MEKVPLRDPLSIAIVHGIGTPKGFKCYKNHYLYKYADKELAQVPMILEPKGPRTQQDLVLAKIKFGVLSLEGEMLNSKLEYDELPGLVVYKLTVLIEDLDNLNHWFCLCDCGRIVSKHRYQLVKKRTKSCGCLSKIRGLTEHLRSKEKESLRNRWRGMIERCHSPEHKNFKQYGGRGISVCSLWRDSPEAFHAWSKANGYSCKLTLDRINVNGNYEPTNCRWITIQEQQDNKRNSVRYPFFGEHLTATEIFEWYNHLSTKALGKKTFIGRLEDDWSPYQAITTPVGASRCQP